MKVFRLSTLFVAAASFACAQQWEFGATGGVGFSPAVGVSSPLGGAASSGFKPGLLVGVYAAHDSNKYFGGEIRYMAMDADLQFTASGSKSNFEAQSHVLHYDVILHTPDRDSKRQLFLAAGGGMKIFRSEASQSVSAQASPYGSFGQAQVLKPTASFGGGVKFVLTRRLMLRTEVRDYLTGFPTELVAPAPGVKVSGIVNQIVPMIGVSFVY